MKLGQVQPLTIAMRILGIETSCDETAAAVVEDGRNILSSVVASQLSTHGKYGGVVPELASREHLRAIVPVVRLALEEARTQFDQLAAVAVTEGPGLVGSLLVGMTYAKSICFARGMPLIAVNHIEGHIHAVLLEDCWPDRISRGGAGRERRAHAPVRNRGRISPTGCSERPATTPPARLTTKSPSCSASAIPAAPSSTNSRRHGNPKAVKFTLARMKGNASRFQLQRIEDGSAPLGRAARSQRGDRRPQRTVKCDARRLAPSNSSADPRPYSVLSANRDRGTAATRRRIRRRVGCPRS